MSEPNVQSEREALRKFYKGARDMGDWPQEVKCFVYECLKFYGNVTTYQGERTGGVLKGCPRGPVPTPFELVESALKAIRLIDGLASIPAQAGEREAFDAWDAALKITEIDESIEWTAWQARAALSNQLSRDVNLIVRAGERETLPLPPDPMPQEKLPMLANGKVYGFTDSQMREYARAALASRAAAQAPAAGDWKIDTSTGRDILAYQGCSVIEGETAHYVMRALAGQASTQAPAGYKLVPIEPTEAMWGGLARDIVWFLYSTGAPHYGSKLHRFLENLGRDIPDWLRSEIKDVDHTPAKGTFAACIYKAMLAAAPAPVGVPDEHS